MNTLIHSIVSIRTRIDAYKAERAKLPILHFQSQLLSEGWGDARGLIEGLDREFIGPIANTKLAEPYVTEVILKPFGEGLRLHQQVLAYLEAHAGLEPNEVTQLHHIRELVRILEGKVQPTPAPTPGPAITLTYNGVTIPITVTVEGKRREFGNYRSKAKA